MYLITGTIDGNPIRKDLSLFGVARLVQERLRRGLASQTTLVNISFTKRADLKISWSSSEYVGGGFIIINDLPLEAGNKSFLVRMIDLPSNAEWVHYPLD